MNILNKFACKYGAAFIFIAMKWPRASSVSKSVPRILAVLTVITWTL